MRPSEVSEVRNVKGVGKSSERKTDDQKINQRDSEVSQVDQLDEIKELQGDEREIDELTKEEIEEELEKLNDAVQPLHKNLSFSLHDETERMMVQVVDLKEDEVLKEIPPEEMLDMLGKIQQMVGLIVDEKI